MKHEKVVMEINALEALKFLLTWLKQNTDPSSPLINEIDEHIENVETAQEAIK